jgi:hypothetical protein
MPDRTSGLVVTLASAIVVFAATVVLLLVFDHRVTSADAVRTGGLAGGAIIALYALWLNDRRRRVEEGRHDLERESNEQDRERVADERFARAVELLGHETDQVRVGGLHALAALARNRPSYTQTVLDVLCSYLRRPFERPGPPSETASSEVARDDAVDREHQVRLTAQRLIGQLLPAAEAVGEAFPDLDLTAAVLDYLDLSGRGMNHLVFRDARLHGTTRFVGARIDGDATFTRASGLGRLDFADAEFGGRCGFHYLTAADRVSFENVRFNQGVAFLHGEFNGPATFLNCTFDKSLDLRQTAFRSDLDLRAAMPSPVRPGAAGMTVSTDHEVRLPEGWTVQTETDSVGKVRSP